MVEGIAGMGSGHMRGLIRAALHGNESGTRLHRKIGSAVLSTLP